MEADRSRARGKDGGVETSAAYLAVSQCCLGDPGFGGGIWYELNFSLLLCYLLKYFGYNNYYHHCFVNNRNSNAIAVNGLSNNK